MSSSTDNTAGGEPALIRFLQTDARDVGCEMTMQLLDAYVDLVLADRDPELTYPGITAHLRSCSPCVEDFEGLLAMAGQA